MVDRILGESFEELSGRVGALDGVGLDEEPVALDAESPREIRWPSWPSRNPKCSFAKSEDKPFFRRRDTG
jgi:hypothetical protein